MGLGLNSSICVAGMGMGASQKMIAVVGDNLANANTTAFKSGRADFSTFLSNNYSYGAEEGRFNTAGANPIQIGMGVRLASVSTNFNEGPIQSGMGPSDVAIAGNGFLIAQPYGSTQQYYTRNGSLKLNGDQDLTTNDGLYIMGYGVNDHFEIQTDRLVPINIPVNKLNIAEATRNTVLEGILDAVGPAGEQGTVLRTKQMSDLSWSSPGAQKVTTEKLMRPNVEKTTTANGTTGGAMEAGDYIYRFAYVDANNVESDYSSPINVSLAAGENAARLDKIPGLLDGYSNVRVYRAEQPADATATAEFYQVATFDPASQNPPGSYLDTRSTADIQDTTQPDFKQLDLGRLNGTYTYYVTYIDAHGNESRPSYLSDERTPGGVDGENVNSGQLLLSDIPTVDPADNPDNWVARRIYRSTGIDHSAYYLVHQTVGLDAGETFIDRIPDSDLVKKEEMSIAGRGDVLANAGTKLLDIGEHLGEGRFIPAFDEGTLYFDPNKGNTDLKTQKLEITSETTVREYLDFIDASYGIRTLADHPDIPPDKGTVGSTINGGSPGATVQDGVFYILGNVGEINALKMSAGDTYMLTETGGKKWYDLGWSDTQEDGTPIQAAVGSSATTTMLVYDTLGAPVSVRMSLVLEKKTDTETVYRWYADSGDNQPETGIGIDVGTGLLTFDQNGKLIDTGMPVIFVERFDVASRSPASFRFNMDVGGVAAMATDDPVLSQISEDGAGAGTMWDYEIQEDGVIMGLFTSNVTRPVGRIVLATFANQEGLVKVGDSLFQQSMNSGQPVLRTPDSVGAGKIKSYSLEMSNTNIGEELIQMILASSMYRANTKVLTTSNEMFDELMRIQ